MRNALPAGWRWFDAGACTVLLALITLLPYGVRAAETTDERAQLEQLLQTGQSVEATENADARQDAWTKFLDDSTILARAHPDQFSLWRLRAVAALELNQPRLGREAARRLLAAPSPAEPIRAALAQLDARGWTTPLKIRTQLPPGPLPAGKYVGRNLQLSDTEIKMHWIPSGSFRMGTSATDTKGRLVHLTRGFWLSETEVTQAQWESVMGMNPSNFQMDHRLARERAMTIVGDDRPVEQVNWAQAMDYCRRLTVSEQTAGRVPPGYGYRLPTEAEWEYAARAGGSGDYPDPVEKYGWFDGNSHDITHEVAGKKANAWGLYDMAGNVAEWCYDWYQVPDDDSEVTDWVVLDPNPEELTGATRVIRGGSWITVAPRCQPSYRVSDDPGNTLSYVGFRIALAPLTNAD